LAPERLGVYFDPVRPEWALVGFVYALETESWDYAYRSLSARSREKFSQLELRVGLAFLEDPRTGIPLIDIIRGSMQERTIDDYASDAEQVVVWCLWEGEKDTYDTEVILVRETDEETGSLHWKVDLAATFERLTGMRLP